MDVIRLHNSQGQTAAVARVLRGSAVYLVAPVVAVVAGVLNGELLPRAELAASVNAWHGKPVTVGHPRRNGRFVAASAAPEMVIGELRDVRVEEDRLRGEMWIDVARAQAMGGDAMRLVTALEGGQPLEVSTGYWCEVTPEQGVFNGKRYAGVQRAVRPDHLALLGREEGACSWRDGCGTPRVNRAGAGQTARGGYDREERGMMDELLVQETDAGQAVDAVQKSEAPPSAAAPDGEATPVANAQVVTVDAQAAREVAVAAALLREFGGVAALNQALATLRSNVDETHGKLVEELVANRACAFSRAELEEMTTGQLQKLAQSLRTPDFAGRGGVRTYQQDEWVVYEAPTATAGR